MQCTPDPLILPGASILPVRSVRDLGVILSTKICLTDTAHALVRALIHSRLDYCNGVLAGLPVGLSNRLTTFPIISFRYFSPV